MTCNINYNQEKQDCLEGVHKPETGMCQLVGAIPCLSQVFTTITLHNKPLQNSATWDSSHLFFLMHLKGWLTRVRLGPRPQFGPTLLHLLPLFGLTGYPAYALSVLRQPRKRASPALQAHGKPLIGLCLPTSHWLKQSHGQVSQGNMLPVTKSGKEHGCRVQGRLRSW